NHTNRPLTDFGGKTSIFSHPVYLFLREFSLQDFRGGSLLTGVMVACLPEKIGSQKNYRCLAGGIGGVVITEIYCAVIVHIKGMASSELFENILSGDSLVVRIIPALLAGVVMSRIITRLPGLDISCPETDSLS
uniref:hypothetical protein n=1 Tax=Escherichia coli TaxID=562 RepID=UPI001D0CA278